MSRAGVRAGFVCWLADIRVGSIGLEGHRIATGIETSPQAAEEEEQGRSCGGGDRIVARLWPPHAAHFTGFENDPWTQVG
jgi:hypothetical protein